MNRRVSCFISLLSGLAIQAAMGSPFQSWHGRSPAPAFQTLNSVAYGNGRFVAVGGDGAIVTSTNGIDWESSVSNVSLQLRAITFGAGRFVAGGDSGVVVWSVDGLSWTRATVPATSHNILGIGFGTPPDFPGGIFVAIASSASLLQNFALTSTNGESWATNATFISGSWSGPYSSVVFASNLFYASGPRVVFPDFGPLPYSTHSFNGLNWILTFTCCGSRIGPIAYGNGLSIMAGNFQITSTGITMYAVTSTAATDWRGGAGVDYKEVPRSACFGGGRYVVVGDGGLTATSSNGTNWIGQRLIEQVQLLGVAYGGGTYIAVGRGGFIASSEDGQAWTQRSRGSSRDLLAVAPDENGFVAVGTRGTVGWSSNGVHWEFFSAPTTSSLSAVVKADGKYVASGAGGMIVSGDAPSNLLVRASGTTALLGGVSSSSWVREAQF
jgi:hypothetical protein